jgi:hypothetical protein
MANEESAELTEPGVGAFDDPSALVSAELPAIFEAPEPAVLAVRNDEVDAALLESLSQRIGVVGAIGDHAFRFLPRTAFGTGDFDFGERGFSRRGTFKPNSQRKTATVDQYHPLRALAAHGFTDCGAPFFAGAKLPSRKVSSHFRRPSPSSAPSSARHASSHTPCSSHCFKRLQRLPEKGICRARSATPRRSVAPIKCLPGRRGSRPTDVPACPCAASVQAAAARSAPTAARSTTQIASCSCKKFNKPPASCRSPQLEAESIYETCSRIILPHESISFSTRPSSLSTFH